MLPGWNGHRPYWNRAPAMTTATALARARALCLPHIASDSLSRKIAAALKIAWADGHAAMKGPRSAVDIERIRAEAAALLRGER